MKANIKSGAESKILSSGITPKKSKNKIKINNSKG